MNTMQKWHKPLANPVTEALIAQYMRIWRVLRQVPMGDRGTPQMKDCSAC
jgi:hypothetical protein